jgi:hypothetical protein
MPTRIRRFDPRLGLALGILLTAGAQASDMGLYQGTVLAPYAKAGMAERMERPFAEDLTSFSWDQRRELAPRIVGALPAKVRHRLVAGFRLATAKLRASASCQSLFAPLSADPLRVLTATSYVYPGDAGLCTAGAAAFTSLTGTRTRLCQAFGELETTTAAGLLIHEALHQAGLPERPAYPTGPTAREINLRVTSNCGL